MSKRVLRILSLCLISLFSIAGVTVAVLEGGDGRMVMAAIPMPMSSITDSASALSEIVSPEAVQPCAMQPEEDKPLGQRVMDAFTSGDGSLWSQMQIVPDAPSDTEPAPDEIASSVTTVPAPTEAPAEPDGAVHSDFVLESYAEGLRIGTVTGSKVFYRDAPSQSGKKLGSLPKGTCVIVFSRKDGWYEIDYRGTKAYMSADYLTSSDLGEGALGYGIVTGSTVNVRQRSAVAGAVIGHAKEGEYVTLIGVSNGWFHVKLADGTAGYIHGEYVSPAADLPPKATPTPLPSPTSSPVPSPTSQPSVKPTATPVPGNSPTPVLTPTLTPAPSAAPSPPAAPSGGEYVTYGTSPYKALNNENAAEVQKILDIAHEQLGIPYVWGGNNRNGFDCGGLVYYVFRQAGYSDFPRNNQYTAGYKITYKELIPGDLVYFTATVGSQDSSHVGIYVGQGKFIHAPNKGKVVCYDSITSGYYYTHFLYGARIIGA